MCVRFMCLCVCQRLYENVYSWENVYTHTNVSTGDEDCQKIQQGIDRLVNWAEKWQMEFNPDKCEVMHFGRSNSGGSCKINGRTIRSIDTQRDLGVQFHRFLKVGAQGVILK